MYSMQLYHEGKGEKVNGYHYDILVFSKPVTKLQNFMKKLKEIGHNDGFLIVFIFLLVMVIKPVHEKPTSTHFLTAIY